jgi:hypothetical protein
MLFRGARFKVAMISDYMNLGHRFHANFRYGIVSFIKCMTVEGTISWEIKLLYHLKRRYQVAR